MKVIAVGIIVLCLLFAAYSGPVSIADNFRDTEDLRLVQLLSFDDKGTEGIEVAVACGTPPEGEMPVRLSSIAESIPVALQEIQNISLAQDLYYPHIAYIMLGESAAKDADMYLDYIQRSLSLRLDSPLIVVYGSDASTLTLEGGTDDSDFVQVLSSMEKTLQRSGAVELYTALDISIALSEQGSALCAAITPSEQEDYTTAVPYGYAVLREGTLVGFLEGEGARGVSVLAEHVGDDPVYLSESGVTVEITEISAPIEASFDDSGALKAITVNIELSSIILELKDSLDLDDSSVTDSLAEELALMAKENVEYVLQSSIELQADFQGIGRMIEIKHPDIWDDMKEDWPETFSKLSIEVNCNASIDGSYLMSGK